MWRFHGRKDKAPPSFRYRNYNGGIHQSTHGPNWSFPNFIDTVMYNRYLNGDQPRRPRCDVVMGQRYPGLTRYVRAHQIWISASRDLSLEIRPSNLSLVTDTGQCVWHRQSLLDVSTYFPNCQSQNTDNKRSGIVWGKNKRFPVLFPCHVVFHIKTFLRSWTFQTRKTHSLPPATQFGSCTRRSWRMIL